MPTGRFSEVDVTPSLHRALDVDSVASRDLASVDAFAMPLDTVHELPPGLGTTRSALERAGFTGALGQTLVLPADAGPPTILVGTGGGDPSLADVRDAAAALANSAPWATSLAVALPDDAAANDLAQAVIEGVFLARYSFGIRHKSQSPPAVDHLTLVSGADVSTGIARGRAIVSATLLGRDLANCPAGFLTAARMADVATEVGGQSGLDVEVFGHDQLVELGCGGLLGVNLGSVDPARMIRLRYVPAGQPSGVLTLVGKGIMYDSGGISLKPSDAVHATMKNDMSGAGAVLAAMSALASLECGATVIGYLMCTDNMPSGSALKLGDVITMRGGTTVEVLNTDAEGRLVMADALVLATEEHTDAIVDIATLTGACLRTFGTEIAGVMGNNQPVVDQVKAAAGRTDEAVWQLPLARRYRNQLDSPVADMTNIGGINAGSITAALFLEEFVDGTPWAHVDIAGTAQADVASSWRPKGATGFGTRMLIDLAEHFVPPIGADA